ncbi:MAG: nucleotide exchange factor GrpE [Paludibacter sp.]|jgi:molecular chaperone GrpE|nr:nucleotide exchange factor GrpE [Paludibacter sp.]
MKYKHNDSKTSKEQTSTADETSTAAIIEEQESDTNAENQEETVENDTAQLEELQQEIEDLKDKNIRLMAEFDNFRKRTAKEKLEIEKTAGERIFTDILTLVDDFERAQKAMETSQDIDAVKEGIELIYSKFILFLTQNGIKAIDTDNADFDTDIHEAVTTFPVSDETQKDKIIDCITKGYTLNDKVIRFAKVVVGE